MEVIKTKVLKELKGVHRSVIIKTSATEKNSVVAWFYYDGFSDTEWKRGCGGVSCEICNSILQAVSKAKRYIEKDYK